MTGSRDVEGMFVFAVGRVMNAWLVEEALFAFTQAYVYMRGRIYSYWEDSQLLSIIGYL